MPYILYAYTYLKISPSICLSHYIDHTFLWFMHELSLVLGKYFEVHTWLISCHGSGLQQGLQEKLVVYGKPFNVFDAACIRVVLYGFDSNGQHESTSASLRAWMLHALHGRARRGFDPLFHSLRHPRLCEGSNLHNLLLRRCVVDAINYWSLLNHCGGVAVRMRLGPCRLPHKTNEILITRGRCALAGGKAAKGMRGEKGGREQRNGQGVKAIPPVGIAQGLKRRQRRLSAMVRTARPIFIHLLPALKSICHH